jgi:hypothetical protein
MPARGERVPLASVTSCGNVFCEQGPPRQLHFVTWKGDHSPRHVHVYRDGRLVLKWNFEARLPMSGKPTARILAIIAQLEKEGVL